MLALVLSLVTRLALTHPDGHWTTGKPLPEPLLEMGAAVLDGKIYVAGGIDKTGRPTAHAYRYDPGTDTWDRVADLPAPRHHMPLAVVGDTLYAVGGFSGTTFRAERTMWAYRVDRNTWEPRAQLPRPRGAAAAAAANGRLIVVGGLERIVDGGSVDVTAMYDPGTDNWRSVLPILTKRDHLTAQTLSGVVYAIGGRLLSADRNYSAVEAYDPARDAWIPKAPMPSERGALGSAVLDGKIHTFGGENRAVVFDTHEVYDPANRDAWTTAAPLPTPRHGCAAVALDGKIYVIGGGVHPGFSESDVVEVFTP